MSNDLNPNANVAIAPATVDTKDAIDREVVKGMSKETKEDLNADPITGQPGSHPVGTGVGSAGGAAAGAAIGAIGGPLGALIGGAIGAIVGGGAGKAAAEAIDPTLEDEYWRVHHAQAPYYTQERDFDQDYRPAYAVGYARRGEFDEQTTFEEAEESLRTSWDEVRGQSRLTWEEAREASRAAWDRVGR